MNFKKITFPARKAIVVEPEVEGRGIWRSRSSTSIALRYISAQRLGAVHNIYGVY